MKRFLLAALGVLALAAQAHASKLSDLAAAMQPGTWALLDRDGDSSGWGRAITTSWTGSALGFAMKAVYDPIDDAVHFGGGGHSSGQAGSYRQLRYRVALDKWDDLGEPPWCATDWPLGC